MKCSHCKKRYYCEEPTNNCCEFEKDVEFWHTPDGWIIEGIKEKLNK